MSVLRVLIPAKGNSRRAPGKNHLLLPFTLDYVARLQVENNAFVMTSCPIIADMARAAKVQVLAETVKGDDFALNFTASFRAAGWQDSDPLVLLEPTKPLRQLRLFEECLARHSENVGRVVTTGIAKSNTIVEYNSITGKAMRRTAMKILDGCVIVTTCGEFSRVRCMSEFWEQRDVAVVWHDAPSGIDFDFPIDLDCHLPTVSRLWSSRFYEDVLE